MNTHPLATVCIACFNGGELVKLAIQSILDQTYSPIELLLIDDGSDDISKDILLQYTHNSRAKVVRFDQNMGLRHARQYAIEQANGKYLFWQDADDIAHPDRIDSQVSFLEQNPEVAVCGTGVHLINEQGDPSGIMLSQTTDERLRSSLFMTMPLISPTMGFRLEMLRLPTTQVPVSVVQAEDYVLLALLLPVGKMASLAQPLYYYRQHNNPHRITDDRNNADIVHGRMIAWRVMLEYLQLQASDEVLLLHDKITYYRNRITNSDAAQYPNYIDLLCKMHFRNKEIRFFDEQNFNAEIAGRIYSTLILHYIPVLAACKQSLEQRKLLGNITCIKLCLNKIRRWLLPMPH